MPVVDTGKSAILVPVKDAVKTIMDDFEEYDNPGNYVWKDRLKEIFKLLNGKKTTIPLVIHGGTGLQPDIVKKLVSLGGSKFNVSTDLKHTLIDATYSYISEHRDEYNPGKIDTAVKEAIRNKIGYWIDLLGSAGKA